MAQNTGENKIIWAVDPFAENKDILKSAAWSLRALTQAGRCQIEPVYVLRTIPSEFPVPESKDFLKGLEKRGQDELAEVLTRIKIPGLKPLRVLSNLSITVRQEARDLIRYATDQGTDLIVVSSHGRKGAHRWLLGSFAETLTLYAGVPFLVVHPNCKRTPEFKTILFPTDFSDESMRAFGKVLAFAERQKGRVVLFHKVPATTYPVVDLGYVAYDFYEKALQDEIAAHREMAKKLVQQAKSRGVRMDVVFDASRRGSVAAAILNRARRFSSVVAMVSQSGPISSVLLGSTTRQVVRYCEQPVWVIHPDRGGRPLYASKADRRIQLVDGRLAAS